MEIDRKSIRKRVLIIEILFVDDNGEAALGK